MVAEVVGFETRKLRVNGKAVRARWVVLRPRQVIKGNPDLSRRYYGYLGELWSSCSARAKRRDLLLTYALSDAPVYLGGCTWSGDLSYDGTRTELDMLLQLTKKSGEPSDGSP